MTHTEALKKLNISEAEFQHDYMTIKHRLRKQLVMYHPDNAETGDADKFKQVNAVYEVLFRKRKSAYAPPEEPVKQPAEQIHIPWEQFTGFTPLPDQQVFIDITFEFRDKYGHRMLRNISFMYSTDTKNYHVSIITPEGAVSAALRGESPVPLQYHVPYVYSIGLLTITAEFSPGDKK